MRARPVSKPLEVRCSFVWNLVLSPAIPGRFPRAVSAPVGQQGRAAVAREACLPYASGQLAVAQNGAAWVLTDGSERLMSLATPRDAANARALARGYHALCRTGETAGALDS